MLLLTELEVHRRSTRLECQNKYFQYGPKSWLISALLYTYKNKIVYDETLLSKRVVYCVNALPGPYGDTPVSTPMYGLPLNQSDQRIRSVC